MRNSCPEPKNIVSDFVLAFGLLAIITVISLVIGLCAPKEASADHGVVRCGTEGVKACLLTVSPFVTNIVKAQHEVTWCVNLRGQQYPGFRSQVAEVMARYAADLRLPEREVAYPDNQTSLSCLVRHDMRDDHPCGNCSAWVYVENYPILIEYNAQTGYVHFFTTIGHELGHAFCLLDEHYDKIKFRSFILTFGYWIHGLPTVMDVGTPLLAAFAPFGIWSLTAYDLARCSETLARDVNPAPPCEGPVDAAWGGRWDSCLKRWVGPDGWSFEPSTGYWYNPRGVAEWGATDPSWGGRWNLILKRWVAPGASFFDPETGIWSKN